MHRCAVGITLNRMHARAIAVLDHWLGPEAQRDAPAEDVRQRWFVKSAEHEAWLRREHGADLDAAVRGDHDGWAMEPRGVLADRERSVGLFKQLALDAPSLDAVEWAIKHRDIIARFNRFPHRNLALNRTSTAEELLFLQEPGSAVLAPGDQPETIISVEAPSATRRPLASRISPTE